MIWLHNTYVTFSREICSVHLTVFVMQEAALGYPRNVGYWPDISSAEVQNY